MSARALRLRWRSAAAVLLLASAPVASAQPAAPVEELRGVEEQRGKAEYYLRKLEAERAEVLAVLEEVERARREADDAALAARREESASARLLDEAAAREKALRAERERESHALGPRLQLRYRLRGDGYLRALLDAPTVGDFLWRRRMVDRVLLDGLRGVQRLDALERQARTARLAVEERRRALQQARVEAAASAARAQERRAAQQEVLAGVARQSASWRRVVAELEASRRRLLATIAALPPTPEGLGGFGALRGRLPVPAGGRVEVWPGKVVDPVYRTEIVQHGIDVRAARGTPVTAPHPAVAAFAGWFRGYGNLVLLDHGEGYFTLYAHLAEMRVAKGERLAEGDEIGTVGDTGSLKGPYLYFEIRSGQKALDPREWLVRR